jgi:hypothetical protein
MDLLLKKRMSVNKFRVALAILKRIEPAISEDLKRCEKECREEEREDEKKRQPREETIVGRQKNAMSAICSQLNPSPTDLVSDS